MTLIYRLYKQVAQTSLRISNLFLLVYHCNVLSMNNMPLIKVGFFHFLKLMILIQNDLKK